MSPVIDRPWDLFFSYAHRDDVEGWIRQFVALVQQIQRELEPDRPWHVFFDSHSIRVLDDWERRISRGLNSAGLMVALVTPSYFASEWCRREWEGFRAQEERRPKASQQSGRLAVLYLETDAEFEQPNPTCPWRQDLKRRQYPDLRNWRSSAPWGLGWLWRLLGHDAMGLRRPERIQQVRQLVHHGHRVLSELLSAEARRFGAVYQLPQMPPHYVARPDEEQELQRHLLTEGTSGSIVISAVYGQGGNGKSTLASAVIRKPAVMDRFPDGILWTTLGQTPEPLRLLADWIRALGDYEFKPVDAEAASARLGQLLQDRAMLLVVDDAWQVEHVRLFQVGGPHCRVLVTTRRVRIADDLGAVKQELSVPTLPQAVAILAARLQRPLSPDEQPQAERLVETLGRLPLALELAAVRISRGVPWVELQADLDAEIARLETLEDSADRRQGKARLEASFNLSLQALRASDAAAWEAFTWLGVLPEDVTLTAPMAATLWDLPSVREADDLLEVLWSEALLQSAASVTIDNRPWRGYRVHDLLHDHARRLLTKDWTLAESHQMLLSRYRDRATGGQFHTLPDDGYVHANLGWHLEKAGDVAGLHALLREETSEGRNGWFEANDRLGQPENFLNDVARIRPLTTAPGLRCRYVLMLASLNSRASNIPAGMLAALVRQGLWPLRQAVVYARQKPVMEDRVDTMTRLIPLATEVERSCLSQEALQAASSIVGEFSRSVALSTLVPHLPSAQREAVLQQALRTAAVIPDVTNRIRALLSLARHLPAVQREAALRQAMLKITEDSYSIKRRRHLLWLVPNLPKGLLPLALTMAEEIKDESVRRLALLSLARHLPAELLPQALRAARGFRDDEERRQVLWNLAPQLPVKLVLEALPAVESWGSFLTRDDGFPFLGSLQQAILAVNYFKRSEERGIALSLLAPHLPNDLLQQALQAATNLPFEDDRGLALSSLVPHLPAGQREAALQQALEAVKGLRKESDRFRALLSLIPHLPAGQREGALQQALQAAGGIQDEYYRSDLLLSLALDLPAKQRQSVLHQALQAVTSFKTNDAQSFALVSLISHLPVELLQQAWEVAAGIRDYFDRRNILSSLAQRMPAELLQHLLPAAASLSDGYWRSRMLSSLAPHLPAGQCEAALKQALQAAAGIQDEDSRSLALSSLAPHLPTEQHGTSLQQALQTVADFGDEHFRSSALLSLAPHLPTEQHGTVLQQALQAAADFGDERFRSLALSSLAPHLPTELLPQALRAAANIGDEDSRSRALWSLAPHLRSELLSQAWQAAPDVESRAAVLARWASFPSAEFTRNANEFLDRLSTGTRREILEIRESLRPIVATLAEENAATELTELAQAIADVGRWWP